MVFRLTAINSGPPPSQGDRQSPSHRVMIAVVSRRLRRVLDVVSDGSSLAIDADRKFSSVYASEPKGTSLECSSPR